MHWNWRIVRYADRDSENGSWFAIDEVYYDDEGIPEAHTEFGTSIGSDSLVGLDWVIAQLRAARELPVLDAENWPAEWVAPSSPAA